MDIELEYILGKSKELQVHAERLKELRSNLIKYKNLLNDAWVSDETEKINAVLEAMDRQIKWLSEELYGIGHDMIRACEEI